MSTEKTPDPPESLGLGEKLADGTARDVASYFVKSLGVLLLSVLWLASTALAWIFSGLSVVAVRLTERLFTGAGYIRVVIGRVKWHEEAEGEDIKVELTMEEVV